MWGYPFTHLLHNGLQLPRVCTSRSKEAVGPNVCFGQDNIPRVGQLAPGVYKGDRAGWGFRGSDGGQRASRPPVVGRAMRGSGEWTLEEKQAWCRSGLHCPVGLRKLSSAGGHLLVPPPWGAQTKDSYLKNRELDVWQKPTQYCEAIFLQLKNKEVWGKNKNYKKKRTSLVVLWLRLFISNAGGPGFNP